MGDFISVFEFYSDTDTQTKVWYCLAKAMCEKGSNVLTVYKQFSKQKLIYSAATILWLSLHLFVSKH